ncbi:MAG TPA: hypothetical protein VMU39_09700 [Solirubrobacteraceae bacterium]|nr:hypothetical protein [Solirubrobacteraceae bacterium]
MPFSRNHPRTTDTLDLSIEMRTARRGASHRRVLNLSEGGMLVAGGRLEVGSLTNFELEGGDFHAAGVAEVEHSTRDVTGLRFVRWDAPADRKIHELIVDRVRRQQHEEAARTVPGGYLG